MWSVNIVYPHTNGRKVNVNYGNTYTNLNYRQILIIIFNYKIFDQTLTIFRDKLDYFKQKSIAK